MSNFIPQGMGWHPDLPDPRDYTFRHDKVLPLLARLKQAEGKKLPNQVDLRRDEHGEYFTPPEDQGPLNSSCAFAVLSLVEYFERRGRGRTFEGSKRFLYKVTRQRTQRQLRVTGDTGADLRTTIKEFVQFGVPSEEHWPYDIDRFDDEPSGFAYRQARPFPGVRYFRLDQANRSGKKTLKAVKSFLSAGSPDYVFAIGSHSRKRKTVKNDPDDDEIAAENIERLRTTEIEPSREHLYRFEIDEDGELEVDSIKAVTLRNIFDNDPLLRRFQAIPSKENGIDIEGIAADGDKRLYIGLRGPVLRGNYVPIIELTFKDKFREKDIEYSTRFVNLGGHGVRDMVKLKEDALLILSGPMGDGPGSYRLYLWDGKDCVPGKDGRNAFEHAKPLCEIPPPINEENAKAEGILVLKETQHSLRFVIVYDSAKEGAPTIFECDR